MTQIEYEEMAFVGEVPPYRLQMIRDVGSMAGRLVERGRMTESTADDVVACMRTYLFGNRFTPEDDGPRAA